MAFTDWSTTAGSNVSIGGIGILGTNKVSNFDNAFRELMAQLRAGVAAKVASTTDNAVVRFNGTTGQQQNSGIILSDADNLSGVANLTATGAIATSGTISTLGSMVGGSLSTSGTLTVTGAATLGSLKIGEASFITDAPLEASTSSGLAVGFEYKGGTGGGGLGINRTSSDGSEIIFYRAATQVGSITVTGSATAYNTSSDYRVKEDVQAYSGGLKAILRLRPSTFVMKSDPAKIRQIGFIAHEVQEVFPLAVTGEKDAVDENGDIIIQQLDQTKTIPALVSAIHDLVVIIDDLKAQVSALTNP